MTAPAVVRADRRRHDKGWLERLLSPIADVRRGEAASALLMTLTMFLVLGGYYLLKTAREIFILSEGGAEVKSYSSAGQALLLLVHRAGLRRVRVARQPHAARPVGHAVLRRQPRALPARARRGPAHRHRVSSCGSASSTSW